MLAPQVPGAPQVPLVLFDGWAHQLHLMLKMFEIHVEQLIPGRFETFTQFGGGGGGGGRVHVNETDVGHPFGSVIQVPFVNEAFPEVPAPVHQLHVNPNGLAKQIEQLTTGNAAP